MKKLKNWLLAAAMLPAGLAAAQDVDIGIPEAGTIAMAADRTLPLRVIYTKDDATVDKVTVYTSRFTNDQGDWVDIGISASCNDAKTLDQPADIPLKSKAATVCIRAGEFHSDAKYTGYITVTPSKGAALKRTFGLQRALTSPAILLTDHQASTMPITRPFLGSMRSWVAHLFDCVCDQKSSRRGSMNLGPVVLLEKSGKYPANSITLQTDAPLKSTGSPNPLKAMTLTWNDADWDDPFATATGATNPKVLGAGAQTQITFYGDDLKAGEYVFPFHFNGVGSNNDNAKFILTVDVRDSIWWAVLTLLFALSLSLVITKLLTGMRRRIALKQRIAALKLSKGTTLPNLPAVVWVDAVLNLSSKLSEQTRFWLTAPDTIDSHVDSVQTTIELLRQARETREIVTNLMSPLMLERVTFDMDRILGELGPEKPDDALAARIKSVLDSYNSLLQDATKVGAFWTLVLPAMQSLQKQIDATGGVGNFPDSFGTLKTALDAALAAAPTAWSEVEDRYKSYARLRILWDCRQEQDVLTALTGNPEPALEVCFQRNDDLAWQKLKGHGGELTIRTPTPTTDNAIEAFAPATFAVECSNSDVTESFLFRRKVKFEWKLRLVPSNSRTPGEVTLAPTTIGPVVAQYFRSPGKTWVSVILRYGNDQIPLPEVAGPDVVASGDIGILNSLSLVEFISWGIAAGLALATGLGTYYFKAPTFGSFQDYLTLFTWGVGVDQGKNFMMALQQVSSQSGGTQGAKQA